MCERHIIIPFSRPGIFRDNKNKINFTEFYFFPSCEIVLKVTYASQLTFNKMLFVSRLNVLLRYFTGSQKVQKVQKVSID